MSSLATRCGSCGTVFRVAQEQIKPSEGWVRCGRCHEVFNALDGLFDLDHEVPPPVPVAWTPQLGHDDDQTLEIPAPKPAAAPAPVSEIDLPLEPLPAVPPEPAGLPRWLDPEAPGPKSLYTPDPEVEAAWARAAEAASAAAGAPAAAATEPALRRQAPPRPLPLPARPLDGPADRSSLWMAVTGLALLLLLQIAGAFRPALQSALPALTPTMDRVCAVLFCATGKSSRASAAAGGTLSFDPPPQLQPIEGASTGTRQRLIVDLLNEGKVERPVPALELTLNDSLGGVLARRVLQPSDLRQRDSLAPLPATLAPGQRLSMQRDFDLPDGARPGGFSVLIAPQP
ncbi:zinc-ribbon and DUF3426 domain-containing protein [Aquariibacter lacus]|uniref:zinc-ribbon and DUF3426 domain-containing protein n=1 Tax=Aquariibacter lacus TaxID=2801332 RepID=UPI0025727946|nr:zinc-ribbon and DUF3426 domain-containing protein [Piscinibacter lacus]